MVVKVGVRNGNPFSSVSDVQKAIQVVLAGTEISREIAVVDPHVGRLVNANSVAIIGKNLADFKVTHDDIADLADVESDAGYGLRIVSGNSRRGKFKENTHSCQFLRRWFCPKQHGSWHCLRCYQRR